MPGEFQARTVYGAEGEYLGFEVLRADDTVAAAPELVAEHPQENGCVTFHALNASYRYRLDGECDGGRSLLLRLEEVTPCTPR